MTETAFSWSVPSRINRILVSFILTVLFSASCQKEAAVTLVGPEGFEISADGSRGATVVFTANRDWTVSCDEPWISFTPSSGPASRDRITLTVHGEANTTHEDRYTGIIITAGEFKKRVTITQPANLEVIASPLSFDLPSATRTITVKAESNIGYDVVIAEDWISHTRTRGLATGTLDFTVSENLYAVLCITDDAFLKQGFDGDICAIIKLLQIGERDRLDLCSADILEAPLWESSVQRHLAAFETDTRLSGSCLLAFMALPCSLSVARAMSAASSEIVAADRPFSRTPIC